MTFWKNKNRESWRTLCTRPARAAKTIKKGSDRIGVPVVRKPVLACLLAWSLIGTSGAIDPQQSSPQSKPHTSPAAAAEKPAGQPPETATAPPEKPAEKHSTLEDRQRLVTVAHKLEM